MKTAIVIPFYNRWDLTHVRMMELYNHTPNTVSIVLINDASTEIDCENGIQWWMENPMKGREIIYHRNAENVGFGVSMNRGMKLASKAGAEVIILLSNDVRVMQDFTTTIHSMLELDKRILIGAEFLCHDTGWNVLPECGVIPYANGWFLASHVDTWKELGGFDPIYGKYDYEDIDLSTKAWDLGIKIVPVAVKLHHMSGQTIQTVDSNRTIQTYRNQKLWREKWADKAKTLKEKIYG